MLATAIEWNQMRKIIWKKIKNRLIQNLFFFLIWSFFSSSDIIFRIIIAKVSTVVISKFIKKNNNYDYK